MNLSLNLGLGLGPRGGASAPSVTTLPTVAVAPTAAWAFRRVISGYTGNLFRVVRTSDSATLDISQTSTGQPDLSTFTTWVSGTTARVDIVYDQVGSNNLTQTTASNRPSFSEGDAYRGAYGSTHDGAGTQWLTIPSALTGNGRATTTFDIAHAASSNSGQGFAQLGSVWSGAGSRCIQLFGNTGNHPRITLLNSAFNTSSAIVRAQPNVIVTAYGTSTDTVRSNGVGGTVAAGSAGTWAGGLIGRISVPYVFGGQFFCRVIYPATLNTTDIQALEAAAQQMWPITFTPDFRLVMAGNSIVQGTGAVRSLQNNPRQADAYFTKRADVINAGVFGQSASTAYAARANYSGLFSASVRSLVVCPEPTNDIDSYTATRHLQVVTTVTADSSSGTNTLLNVSSTASLSIGQYIQGTGVAAGTTITNIAGSTVTMSANATATGTGVTFTAKVGFTATRTSGSNVLTGVTNFNGIATGQIISATGIPTQTTITSFDSGAFTITMSANATASGTSAGTTIDPALVAADAATLWTGATGVRPFFSAMTAGGYAAADVFAPTTLPRNWTTGEGNSRFDGKEAVRRAYNALIAADQAGFGYTVLDYAGIPAMANPSGSNYADGIHPNSTNFLSGLEVSGNGYGYMAKLLSDAVNVRVP